MSVQFIGMIQPHEISETFARKVPVIDPSYVMGAQAHEQAGIDRFLKCSKVAERERQAQVWL